MSAPELQNEAIAVAVPEPWWKHVRDAVRGVPHDYTEVLEFVLARRGSD